MVRTTLMLLALGAGLGLGAGLSCPRDHPGRAVGAGGADGAWVALPALPGAGVQVMALAAQAQDPGARITARWSLGPPALLTAPARGRWLRPDSLAGLVPGAWTLVQASQGGGGAPAPGPGPALRRVASLGAGGWLELEAALPAGLDRPGDLLFALAPPPAPPGQVLPLGAGRRELFQHGGLLRAPAGAPLLVGVEGGGGWCALEVLAWGPVREGPEEVCTQHVVN